MIITSNRCVIGGVMVGDGHMTIMVSKLCSGEAQVTKVKFYIDFLRRKCNIFTLGLPKTSLKVQPAPRWGIRPNAPRWGGGADSAPCLTPERMVVERRGKNGKRKFSTRRILRTPKILPKEVRGQVRVRSKVKTTGFHIIGFRAQLAQR